MMEELGINLEIGIQWIRGEKVKGEWLVFAEMGLCDINFQGVSWEWDE